MVDKILTIIIPSYNMENYISKCLQSLIICEKLLKQLEILVVNDGSKDSTLDIVNSYHERYPSIIEVIDKPNGNYGSCVNAGLKYAKGKYIKILDADDTFETANFEKFVEYLLTLKNVDLIFSDFCKITTDNVIKDIIKYPLNTSDSFQLKDLPENINNTLFMHAVTYKTENLRKINYHQTEGISYTDQEWIFLPFSRVKLIAYFPKIIYKYLVNRDGQTMNPQTFCNNIWMEIEGTKIMIDEFESKKNNFPVETIPILTRQVAKRTSYIYRWYLQFYYTNLNINDLYSFDKYLKTKSPYLYDYISEETIQTKLFKFYFIKDFRNKKKLHFFIWKVWKSFKQYLKNK